MSQVYIYEQSHNNFGSPLSVVHMESGEFQNFIYCNWHREIELVYVAKGRLHLVVDDRKLTLSQGDVGIVNMDEVHYGDPDSTGGECEVYIFLLGIEPLIPSAELNLKKYLVSLSKGEVRLVPALTPAMPNYNEVVSCLIRMNNVLEKKRPAFELYTAALMYELLYHFFAEPELLVAGSGRGETQSREKIERLNEVIRYIEQNYTRKIYIAELAEQLYMGVDNFYKFFVSVTGISPASYINSYRMKQAANLFVTTGMPVTDICYKVGFNNVSYFIKMFQKFYGYTPKKYRSLSQEKGKIRVE